jgi:Bacterial protein of unknown function (DUF899)
LAFWLVIVYNPFAYNRALQKRFFSETQDWRKPESADCLLASSRRPSQRWPHRGQHQWRRPDFGDRRLVAALAGGEELTRRSDALALHRQALPWVRPDKDYVFDTGKDEKTLADLFDGRSQLLVYHAMFGPDWTEGCPAAKLVAVRLRDGRRPASL